MGYRYNEQTGETYSDRDLRYMTLGTDKNWCPYYNLEGKYVGTKYGFNYTDGNLDYYKPSTRKIVKNYEDLDW